MKPRSPRSPQELGERRGANSLSGPPGGTDPARLLWLFVVVALADNAGLCLEGEAVSGLTSTKGYELITTSKGLNKTF